MTNENKTTNKKQIIFLVLVLIGFLSPTIAGFIIYALPKFLISKYFLKNKEAKSNIIKDTAMAGLILGIILLIGQRSSLNNQEVSNREPTQIRTTKNDADEELTGNLYRNNKYGFRVKFPDGWNIKKGDGIHIVQKATLGNNTISILVQQLGLAENEKISSIKDAGTAKEYIDIVMSGVKASNVEIIDYGETKIDNEPAYWVEYSGDYQVLDYKAKMTNLVYILAKGDIIYSITAGTVSDEYQQIKPTFLKTVSTFVLEKNNF
jgi:hypothetical protein